MLSYPRVGGENAIGDSLHISLTVPLITWQWEEIPGHPHLEARRPWAPHDLVPIAGDVMRWRRSSSRTLGRSGRNG